MWGINIKKRIESEVMSAVAAYKENNRLTDMFMDPVIGYASAKDPLFMTFYERNWTLHPKEIYMPGNTVIVHFLPFAKRITESNRIDNCISEEWVAAYNASILFSAIINDSIKGTLESYGRLASLTNLPGDWNEEIDGPNWSHKLAAFIAGMGNFGIAGSFNTPSGSGGRFGSLITEYIIEPTGSFSGSHADKLNSIADGIKKSYLYTDSRQVQEQMQVRDQWQIQVQDQGQIQVQDQGQIQVQNQWQAQAQYQTQAEDQMQTQVEAKEQMKMQAQAQAHMNQISDDKILCCPASAITQNGVDRNKCRAFCAAQKQIVPSPDVCGKCFD